METGIAVFRGKEIRKTIHNNEWWFLCCGCWGWLLPIQLTLSNTWSEMKREIPNSKGG